MKKSMILLAMAMIFALPAQAEQIDDNYIQVNGYAQIEVIPNEYYLTITLDQSDSKGRVDIDLQRQAMVAALKSLNIDTAKDLTVMGMSSDYFRRNQSLSAAQYQLKLSTIEQVGAVFDKLGSLNLSNINIARVSHADLQQLKSQVRKQAVFNAKQKAVELAEATGQSLGYCIRIEDYNNDNRTSYTGSVISFAARKSNMEDSIVAQEPIEFRKIKIDYSISARFILYKD